MAFEKGLVNEVISTRKENIQKKTHEWNWKTQSTNKNMFNDHIENFHVLHSVDDKIHFKRSPETILFRSEAKGN